MTQDRHYKSVEEYANTFYQLPTVLFTNPKYKNISNDAKVAYALLKDRFNYSVRNHWIDEDDNIYFIFTNAELMTLLSSGNQKVIKIKKELEQVELLEQKRMGVNHPNRLYLLRPEVTATDVYLQANAETLDNSGSVKITHNLYNNYLDTNRYNIDTDKLDFSTSNFSNEQIKKQNQDLTKNAKNFLTSQNNNPVPFEPETIQLLSLWAGNNPKIIHKTIGIILDAKKKMELEHQDINMHFMLDDDPELQAQITQTLRRYFNALRNDDKKINNQENYLFVTMKNMFGNYWNATKSAEWEAEHPDEAKRQQAILDGLFNSTNTTN